MLLPDPRDPKPSDSFDRARSLPLPGSPEELAEFKRLKEQLLHEFRAIMPDPRAYRTVVVVPSLSITTELIAKISGVQYYEERLLFMLMLLRQPNARLVYVTSQPIAPSIVDYYLNLLPGVPVSHARQRLTLLSCYDTEPEPLTLKVLERPRLIRRIREAIADPGAAHLTVFNATQLERTLAVRLGIPLYGCDPGLCSIGTKSGSRKAFIEVGIPLPNGREDLRDEDDIVAALTEIKQQEPGLSRAVVKLDEGVSGEGNAIFDYRGAPEGAQLKQWIAGQLPKRLKYEAATEDWEGFSADFIRMGGVVEAFIDGVHKRSPSMQGRIDPVGIGSIVSTHDQILGGPSGQIFLGCSFPANAGYRLEIQDLGARVGSVLREQGVLGRYGVDFISRKVDDRWEHYAIEINIRKGGTTHPFLMLQYLTDGYYDTHTGTYSTPNGQERCYYASDNVVNPLYRGFTPEDLTDISVDHQLHFHGATQEGVVFHLIGALSQYGKLGVLCISDSIENARKLYLDTVYVLDQEALAQENARSRFRPEPTNEESTG